MNDLPCRFPVPRACGSALDTSCWNFQRFSRQGGFQCGFFSGNVHSKSTNTSLKGVSFGLVGARVLLPVSFGLPPPSGCLVALPGSLVVAGQVRKDGASPSTPPQTVGASGLRSSKPPVGTRGKGWLIRVDRLVENGKRA